MKKNVMDMTRGPIMPQLVKFGTPVLLGMLFQRIYNFVDVFIVGRYLGDEALAAVSIAGSAMYLLMSLMMGLTTGVSIVISQYYGAGNEQKVRQTFASSIFVAIGAAAMITVFGMLGAKGLLGLLHTSDELLPMAHEYLMIIFAGCAGTMLYNWISAVMRSLGNSVVPLVFLIVSSVLNVILDILLIAVIPMGVAGAALATVLAQTISGVLCLVYAFKVLPLLRLKRGELRMDVHLAKQILVFGIPTGLQMSIISISDMALQSKINTYETALIVAYGVATKVEFLGWQLAEAIGTAVGTFVGQNVGAGRLDRVQEGVKKGMTAGLLVATVLVAGILIFGENLMRMFTETQEVVSLGVHMLHILAVGYIAMAVTQSLSGVMRGAGDTMTPMWISLITTIIIRMPLAYGLAFLTRSEAMPNGNPDSLFISLLVSWVMGALLTTIAYRRGKWRKLASVKI